MYIDGPIFRLRRAVIAEMRQGQLARLPLFLAVYLTRFIKSPRPCELLRAAAVGRLHHLWVLSLQTSRSGVREPEGE